MQVALGQGVQLLTWLDNVGNQNNVDANPLSLRLVFFEAKDIFEPGVFDKVEGKALNESLD